MRRLTFIFRVPDPCYFDSDPDSDPDPDSFDGASKKPWALPETRGHNPCNRVSPNIS